MIFSRYFINKYPKKDETTLFEKGAGRIHSIKIKSESREKIHATQRKEAMSLNSTEPKYFVSNDASFFPIK
jgi:hypothetical protein